MTEQATATATLRETVATRLASLSDTVLSRVADAYAEKEANRRADAIVRGLDALDSLERSFVKINRPDNVTFNADGSPATSSYSRARLDEIANAEKKMGKLVGALDKAISGDLGDLLGQLGGNSGGGQGKPSPEKNAE